MAMGSSSRYAARDAEERARREELARLCRRDGLPLPWGPYRAAPHTCYRCGRRVVVYAWVGHEPWSANPPPPPPRPRTLKLRRTLQSGGQRYWVNTCSRCGAVQGDNYLYHDGEPGEPPPFRFTWLGARIEIPGDVLPALRRDAAPRDEPRGNGG